MKAPNCSDIPVAILCGGKGTRLGKLTTNLPKSLVDVGGFPFIRQQLFLLEKQRFKRCVLCIQHLGYRIVRALSNAVPRLDIQVTYADEGPTPMGTGGAVLHALPMLSDEFFVMYGDSYLPIDYAPILGQMRDQNALACMSTWDGVDYGINAFRSEAFAGFAGSFDIHDVFDALKKNKRLATYASPQRFYEIGSPEGLAEVRALLNHDL